MSKSKEMQQFQDSLAKALFGNTVQDAKEHGLCIDCRQPALENCYSDAGRKEYQISGLCEKCFDRITGGGE